MVRPDDPGARDELEQGHPDLRRPMREARRHPDQDHVTHDIERAGQVFPFAKGPFCEQVAVVLRSTNRRGLELPFAQLTQVGGQGDPRFHWEKDPCAFVRNTEVASQGMKFAEPTPNPFPFLAGDAESWAPHWDTGVGGWRSRGRTSDPRSVPRAPRAAAGSPKVTSAAPAGDTGSDDEERDRVVGVPLLDRRRRMVCRDSDPDPAQVEPFQERPEERSVDRFDDPLLQDRIPVVTGLVGPLEMHVDERELFQKVTGDAGPVLVAGLPVRPHRADEPVLEAQDACDPSLHGHFGERGPADPVPLFECREGRLGK